ncbi:AbrB family transcriptional regulator [Propylenella binzhouense]|uniref:AbrB family transcriptional regulator n=1 Tax=Propylenella binzhouense TaxID=2555902 RepID=UPI00136F2F18|nr:AbrB family transcriptional regulator [Propylenella binzhouense]
MPGIRPTRSDRAAILRIVKTLAVAAVGGALFKELHIPLAWMLGALLFTGVGGRLIGPLDVPRTMRDTVVPVLGVLLGSGFTPEVLGHLGRWPAGLAAVLVYVVVSAIFGVLYFRLVVKFDPLTAFFSAIPGGLSDLTLLGASLGADLGRLALIHSMRIIVVVTTIPFGVRFLTGTSAVGPASATAHGPFTAWDLVALVLCAALGTFLGRKAGLPATPVLGPLLVSAAAHLAGLTAVVPPPWLVILAQIVLGGYIGSRLSGMAGATVRAALLHGLVWGVVLVVLAFAAALVTSRASAIAFPSMLLGIAPGGLPEMAVITLALNVDIAFVTVCHLTRIVAVYLITPFGVRLGGWTIPARRKG